MSDPRVTIVEERAVVVTIPAGIPGHDGADGAPGRDGLDGAPGHDGADGLPGRDGSTPTIEFADPIGLAPGSAPTVQVEETAPHEYRVTLGLVAGADGAAAAITEVAVTTLAHTAPASGALVLLGAGEYRLELGVPRGAPGADAVTMTVRTETLSAVQYVGSAPLGTVEAAPVWRVTRLGFGSPPVVVSAVGAWSDRASLIYS